MDKQVIRYQTLVRRAQEIILDLNTPTIVPTINGHKVKRMNLSPGKEDLLRKELERTRAAIEALEDELGLE